jgi:hypothetical protein
MTATAATAHHAPFGFAPAPTQDADFLRQLSFVPGLKELLTVRQVHALEHATVWVLSEAAGAAAENAGDRLGGMSTETGFYIYGAVETEQLRRAAQTALHRLVGGDWDLAVHPRCGTNLSVGILLTAGLLMGAQLVLPKDPLGQILGLGLAATAAAGVAPDAGQIAQRYLTTAIPFNLAIQSVENQGDRWGQPTHFVRVAWVESGV